MQTLAHAGELSLKPRWSEKALVPSGPPPEPGTAAHLDRAPARALAVVARNDPEAAAFVERFVQKHCKRDVSEEWTKVDDRKIDKLRGVLAALKEENQSIQLLKRESDDREAGRDLEGTRADVRRRMQVCKAQEVAFEQKQADLRRRVMENEKALRSMETNIEKGERKAKEEQNECRRLDSEIKSVLKSIDDHEEDQRWEERLIAKASEHRAFLESVVSVSEQDFEGDIENLMNRFSTLDAEKRSLHQRNTALATQLNSVREEWTKVQAELQTEQMMSSSRLHEAQVELERYRSESQELETRLNRMQEERELKKSQVGIILMAIDQIFTRIVQSCRHKQRKDAMLAEVEDKRLMPVRSDRDTARLEAMLNQIISRVRDLRDMSEKVKYTVERDRQPQMANMEDEVDILDKVKFVYHRDRPERLLPESGTAGSELTTGTSVGSKQAGGTSGTEMGISSSQGSAASAAGAIGGASAGTSGASAEAPKKRRSAAPLAPGGG